MPLPSDHVRTIVELMRGGTPDLARRWLAALLLVPPGEREEVVKAVERRVVEEYCGPSAVGKEEGGGEKEVVVRYPAVQREGYVEEVVKRYGVVEEEAAAREEGKRGRGRRSG